MVASFKKITLLIIVFTVFAIADSPVVDQRKHVMGQDTLNLADGDEVQRLMDGLYDELAIIKRTKAGLDSRITRIEKDILLLNQGDYEFYGHTHDASDIVSGILDTARYHAYNDLVIEAKIGHSAGQVVGGPEFIDSILARVDSATFIDSCVSLDTAITARVDTATFIDSTTALRNTFSSYSLTTWIQGQIDDLNDRIDSVITNCCP